MGETPVPRSNRHAMMPLFKKKLFHSGVPEVAAPDVS
jgi:hypothetical protein